MELSKKKILREWLEIEFNNTAAKTGYIPDAVGIASKDLIFRTIRVLDKETTKNSNIDRNYIISIIAMLWEHVDHDVYDIRTIVIRFLTRIGYPTSAIVTDKQFDKAKCQFSTINSLIDEIVTSAKLQRNAVTICEQAYLLTDFQMDLWRSMDNDKHICISAPTSAGKSFVILLKIVSRLISQTFDVLYIVPTLSLVNQVTEDFYTLISKFGINNCSISNTYIKGAEGESHIYVLTQEKAIAAIAEDNTAFSNSMVLVCDEIQNIERILDETDERAKILFDVLNEFRGKDNVTQTIISGPRIERIGRIGKQLWGAVVRDHSTTESPVLNLTYSIRRVDRKFYLKQYNNLTGSPIVHEVTNTSLICDYGKKMYSDDYLQSLNNLINNIGIENQNIVFAPTSKTARKIALSLSGRCLEDQARDLVAYYSETVHPQYSLCETISKGVAYHHGKLPLHVRRTIETAISEKVLTTVVCTTTLMQGVNLPAQNIIIRNPHLYLKRGASTTELSNYEMANLRGRAGRLMKEFVGRTFVLDEGEFEEFDGYEQQSLFEDVKKELPTGYEGKFEEYCEDIQEAVLGESPVDNTMYEYGYLVTYIRQTILRYGKNALPKMKNVGIQLTSKQVAAIIQKLDQLTIPKQICLKNRYWDPFVLDYIYKNYNGTPPSSFMERGAKNRITEMMHFLRDSQVTSTIYQKYIPDKYQSGRNRSWLLKIASDWALDVPLKAILSDARYSGENGTDEIEDTIEVLQNIVSYNLPLLLKPIFDIKQPDNMILASLQSGTSDPYVVCMIEMGIPRETALYIKEKLKKEFEQVDASSEAMRSIIQKSVADFPYWIKVQLRFLG